MDRCLAREEDGLGPSGGWDSGSGSGQQWAKAFTGSLGGGRAGQREFDEDLRPEGGGPPLVLEQGPGLPSRGQIDQP